MITQLQDEVDSDDYSGRFALTLEHAPDFTGDARLIWPTGRVTIPGDVAKELAWIAAQMEPGSVRRSDWEQDLIDPLRGTVSADE